jgi:hypothetical protein
MKSARASEEPAISPKKADTFELIAASEDADGRMCLSRIQSREASDGVQ